MSKVALLEDEKLERQIIALELKNTKFFKPIPPEFFQYANARKTQSVMNACFEKLGAYPIKETLFRFSDDADVHFFVEDVSTLTVDESMFKHLLDELFDIYANRRMMDEVKNVVKQMQKGESGKVLLKATVNKFLDIRNPIVLGEVQRGYAHDQLQRHWQLYKDMETHPERFRVGIPYGMAGIDRITNGGMRRGHIHLIYGDTSSGKTRFKANVAYNMAVQGFKVLYISIEVPFDDIVRMWVSRASMLPYTDIELAKLSGEQKDKYRDTLKVLYKDKNLPFVVYWPGEATSADVERQIELYIASEGTRPDVVIIDYANEMYPNRSWTGSSDRFNYLFSELRVIAATYETGIITSLQQSREGTKKRKDEDRGLEDIGQSHYVAPHCHVVFFIKQTKSMEGGNELEVHIRKNRYGKKNEVIPLKAHWALSYVGDLGRIKTHEDFKKMLKSPPNALEPGSIATDPVNEPTSPAEE